MGHTTTGESEDARTPQTPLSTPQTPRKDCATSSSSSANWARSASSPRAANHHMEDPPELMGSQASLQYCSAGTDKSMDSVNSNHSNQFNPKASTPMSASARSALVQQANRDFLQQANSHLFAYAGSNSSNNRPSGASTAAGPSSSSTPSRASNASVAGNRTSSVNTRASNLSNARASAASNARASAASTARASAMSNARASAASTARASSASCARPSCASMASTERGSIDKENSEERGPPGQRSSDTSLARHRRRSSWCLNDTNKLKLSAHLRESHGQDRSTVSFLVPAVEIIGDDESDIFNADCSEDGSHEEGEAYTSPDGSTHLNHPHDISLGERGHQTLRIGSDMSHMGANIVREDSQISLGVSNKYSSAMVSMTNFTTTMKSELRSTPWVLRPNSQYRLAWDALISSACVIIGFIIPLGLVYTSTSCGSDVICLSAVPKAMLYYVFDVLWPIDIVLNFRTGYFSHGEVEMRPKFIALHYMRRWLALDLLAALPLALTRMNGSLHIVACALKLLRLLQVIPRITRVQAEYRDIGLLPTKIMIAYMLLAHTAACGWRLVHDEAESEASRGSWWPLYVADLYWVVMTFTTIGYGDIFPRTWEAQIYAMVVMSMGSASFGAVISACTHITNKVFNDEIESQVADVMRFMVRRSVPKDTQRRVQRNLRHHLHSQRLTSIDPELLAMLSPTMQRELSLSLLGSTVLRFPLFKNTQRSFLAELAQVHCWVQCMAGDVVLEEGEILQNLIFLIRGKLVFRASPGADTKRLDVSIAEALKLSLDNDNEEDHFEGRATNSLWMADREKTISAGAWFGEACLMDQERICAYTVLAVTGAELAVLAAVDYLRVVQKYPKLWEKHQSIERGLASGTLSMERLAYKAPRSKSRDFHTQKVDVWRHWFKRFFEFSDLKPSTVLPASTS